MIKIVEKLRQFVFLKQGFRFSENIQQNKHKSYIMPPPVSPPLVYKPNKPLHFINGRCLIYMNRQNLSTPYLITLHYTAPMLYIAYLIKNNPFYLTFPASLPIMFMLEFLIFLRFAWHKRHYKTQIERIYVLQSGEVIQFFLSNHIRRVMKDHPDRIIQYISQTPQPQQSENDSPLYGQLFPTSLDNIRYPSRLRYGWSKYFKDRNNFIIPARYDYANWQILIKVLNGVAIDTSNKISEGGEQKIEVIPRLEDQMKRLASGALKNIPKQKQTKKQVEKSNNQVK